MGHPCGFREGLVGISSEPRWISSLDTVIPGLYGGWQ